MPTKRFRTISCADDSRRNFKTETAVYAWIGQQPPGTRFRVVFDEGYDWQPSATVRVGADGIEVE
jgi:hypothetical protein